MLDVASRVCDVLVARHLRLLLAGVATQQTALLQTRLGVVPVAQHNELLQNSTTGTIVITNAHCTSAYNEVIIQGIGSWHNKYRYKASNT